MKKIGEVAQLLNISIDTLRYYEKIKLLGSIQRTDSGIRLYSKGDLSRIQFIKQAQKMGFSLEEISQLLSFRDSPETVKPQIRQLAQEKLSTIESHIDELVLLRDELRELIEQCQKSTGDCPILEKFEKPQKK